MVEARREMKEGVSLDELDAILDDKDTFLVKLPNQFKDYLKEPQQNKLGYSLTAESRDIGFIESTAKSGP